MKNKKLTLGEKIALDHYFVDADLRKSFKDNCLKCEPLEIYQELDNDILFSEALSLARNIDENLKGVI